MVGGPYVCAWAHISVPLGRRRQRWTYLDDFGVCCGDGAYITDAMRGEDGKNSWLGFSFFLFALGERDAGVFWVNY